MSTEFASQLSRYEPAVQAFVKLLHPFAEVAIHDLEKGVVAAIYHNISQRKIGETSPLTELKIPTDKFPDVFPPYYKCNWDGRPLKCTSITMRDKKGKAIGLICLNLDVSYFQDAQQLLRSFLTVTCEAENPIELFGNRPEDEIETIIKQFLQEKQLSLRSLNRLQKRELVLHLHGKGVFNFKNAAPLVAKKLSMSRASIYNHIKRSFLCR